ncbi:energy-coupling factor ABC transporter permease [Bartonella sp. HY761]|uniref:energy-coupling factor ABC transporter permease n=1 Tax=Bartonella sp. HY761 TaxID=2979330 RepID=UPI0021FAA7FF|nr:energy-coupling factor ABC transporter permease [Bartonella sp. HY761]UXN06758.1 energy-coupling factor ABC transporter permease [Bartonella sp. HY761]
MHIEPGVVSGAKIILSYATAFAALGITAKLALKTIFPQKTSDSFHQKSKDGGIISLLARSLITTALVFTFFEIFPHHPVGVSEVHLILGSTLFLIFGVAPTAIGLTLGLLLQGLFFAPFDLPQYGMNVTTLLMPLFAMAWLANKIIPQNTAYKDVSYKQALALSTSYQGGIVAWVAFWAFYGEGFSSETAVNIGSFAIAYMSVVLVEPLIDLGVLFIAKSLHKLSNSPFIQQRLYQAIN